MKESASKSVAYRSGKVLARGRFRDDLVVITRGARISSVQGADGPIDDGVQIIDLAGDYLLPGFIDTQVNGGGGVLFNDQPTVEGIRTIAEAHRAFGTTSLLPTLISDDLEVVEKGLKAARDAIAAGVPGVRGIHIEGPFLNAARRGVHAADKIRPLSREILDGLSPLPNGCTLLTVAPETIEPGMISELVDRGFIVSCGHSDATRKQVKMALQEGLRGFTHLYNAMSQLMPREPGVVGQALADDVSWCGIIADGHHVAAESLEIAWRCKGAGKLMLVTDAMPPVGGAKTSFQLLGNPVSVRDGVCIDAHGTLAGAALDMASAVRNMTQLTSCSFADACTMASTTPAAFLGIDDQRGSIEAGQVADLVIMSKDRRVRSALIAGQTPDLSLN